MTTPELNTGSARLVGLVAQREISTRLRSKSFLISTGILLLLVLGGIIFGSITAATPENPRIAVTDASVVESIGEQIEEVPVDSVADAEQLVRDGDVEAAVVPDDSTPLGIRIIADSAEPRFIGERSKRRCMVDLPIAGMDDIAERRADDQRHRLGDGVIDADRFDLERTDIDAVAFLEDGDRHLGAAALIGALGFKHAGGERRSIDRHVEARPQIGQRAVMVFVGMGDDDALEVLALFGKEPDIGKHQIDAGQIKTREGHAAIDHDPLAVGRRAIAVKGQVHADFPHSA